MLCKENNLQFILLDRCLKHTLDSILLQIFQVLVHARADSNDQHTQIYAGLACNSHDFAFGIPCFNIEGESSTVITLVYYYHHEHSLSRLPHACISVLPPSLTTTSFIFKMLYLDIVIRQTKRFIFIITNSTHYPHLRMNYIEQKITHLLYLTVTNKSDTMNH